MNVQKPRIEPVTDPTGEVAEALERTGFARSDGPLNIFATLAHHPRLLRRYNALGGLYMAHGLLPVRLRELVVLRVAWRTRCEYEWGQHVLIGRRAGVVADELEALTVDDLEPAAGSWSAVEHLALRVADGILDAASLRDDLWDEVSVCWSDAEILELVTLVGFYRMTSGVLNAARVQREPGVPGWPAREV